MCASALYCHFLPTFLCKYTLFLCTQRNLKTGAYFLISVNLEDFHLSERIAQLILRLHLPSEFLVKALVLLLNGRVSTLMHPPPDPVPDPSSLVKVPISEDSRKRLLDWLKSPKAQDETLISSEARQDLTKALL